MIWQFRSRLIYADSRRISSSVSPHIGASCSQTPSAIKEAIEDIWVTHINARGISAVTASDRHEVEIVAVRITKQRINIEIAFARIAALNIAIGY